MLAEQLPAVRRRLELAEKRHCALDRKAAGPDFVKNPEKLFVKKPGVDDERSLSVSNFNRTLAPESDRRLFDPLDPDQIFGLQRTQRAFDAGHEFLVAG